MNTDQINVSPEELRLRSIIVSLSDHLRKSNTILSKHSTMLNKMPNYEANIGANFTATEKLRIDNIDLLNSVKETASTNAFSINVVLSFATWLEDNPDKDVQEYIKHAFK